MRTDSKFLKILLILSILGVLVAGWLFSLHLKFTTGQALLTESCSILPIGGAGDSQGCASVAVSDYSRIMGIPLPAIAMSFYFTIFFLVLWAWRNPQTCYEPLYTGFFLSTLSIPVTVLMFFIAKYKLQSFCVGCSMLWLINLSIWPAFVKQLGLTWGNALEANLEIFRHKKLHLLRQRLLFSFGTGGVLLAVFAVTGGVALSMQTSSMMSGDIDRAILEFRDAKQVFLPPEAYEGFQVKPSKNPTIAPILDIVEFSDLQCPACRMAAYGFKPFLLKYADRVRFSYRQFPLDGACNPFAPNGGHRYGCALARAAYCAGTQGKFFLFHDLAFDHQEEMSATLIDELAAQTGINMDQYKTCLSDPKTESALQKEMQWGDLIGLQSTPTIVINGKKLAGAMSPQQLEALLKAVESGNIPPRHGD